MTPTYLGNMELLQREKVAYFCSRNYAPKAVLASYDWATAQHDKVVISTFHSPLERDVMDFLLQKKQPLIYVLPAHMYKRVPVRFKEALDDGRLLFVSLLSEDVRMYSQTNSDKAIRYILDHVEEIVFGCIAPNSNNERLQQSLREDNKKRISILVK